MTPWAVPYGWPPVQFEEKNVESKDLAYEIARIIDEKKGHDITILDLRDVCDIAEYFVIATGDNNRMVDAIVDEVENCLREKDIRPFAIEGREDNTWDLLDFGHVIVHVFQPEARDFYRLDRLWGDAPRLYYVDGELEEGQPVAHDRQDRDSENADRDAYLAARRAVGSFK